MEESPKSPLRKAPVPTLRIKLYRCRRLLIRLWWIPLLTVSAALCIQGYLISTEPPAYVSFGRMWVSGKVSLPEGGMYREELQNFFGTQIELMRSELIQNRAHTRVKLLKPNLSRAPVQLKVLQAPRAAVFILQAVGTEPAYTQGFMQALMEEYLAVKKEMRAQSTDEALSAVREQIYRPQGELQQELEKELAFKKENNVVFLQEQGNSAASYLAKLNNRLSDLKTEYQLSDLLAADQAAEAAAKLTGQLGDGKSGGDLGGATAGYQKVKEQLLALKAERKEWGLYLKDKHPKMEKMDQEIKRMEGLLGILREQSKEQLASSRESIKLQIQNLEQNIKEWETKALESSRKMAEYDRIKANVTRLQSLSDRLQNTMQSLGVNRNLDQENVSIMEAASAATTVTTGIVRKMLLALLVGAMAAVGIIYLVDRQDDRISSIGELMQLFERPVIGHIPGIEVRKKQKLPVVHPQDQRHAFVEAFRDIRSAILFANDKGGIRPKTILITSAIPNEGKSAVSANLAVTLALSGSRVLLVDADLRCGTSHEFFNAGQTPGLHEVLTGELQVNDVIRATTTPNLHLIAAGKPTQTAGELFLSPVTESFIKEVYPLYDFVVIDSAPVLATADTASLAPNLDGVLFVIRGSFTSARLSKSALDLLEQRQVNILGLVLNRVDSSFPEYYQYKYKKYYQAAATA
ncbi:MAG TPA: polysaccharide biosynthesis tyrosine autokinase [Verrucomicrobiae bacterium]|jgi:capsular exopolysaccharide synthesis family protein